MVRWATLVGLIFAPGCSPYGGGSFMCDTDQQCGSGGTCSDQYCSFPDGDCPTGLRYGERSGPFSKQCVGPQGDGGVDTPTGEHCYGTGLVVACFSAEPSGAQTIAA